MIGSQARGVFRLGTIGSLSASFLPRSLAALREQFPRVEIEILELQADEQQVALLAGTIQLGFQIRIPGTPVDPRFSVRPVIDCAVSVALPARHPLVGGRTVSLKALAGEKLLNLQQSPGAAYGHWVRAVCEQEGMFSPRFRRGPTRRPPRASRPRAR